MCSSDLTEEILAQNPDFVILNAEVSEQTALHEFLQEAGVPHAYFKTNMTHMRQTAVRKWQRTWL